MLAPAAAHQLDSATATYRRAGLLAILGCICVVGVFTLTIRAWLDFVLADQLLLLAMVLKNAALFVWLWRRPQAFLTVGLIEFAIQAVGAVVRLYVVLHVPPGLHGLGGYVPWIIFAYLIAFVVLPLRRALLASVALYATMIVVATQYLLDPAIPDAVQAGLGNPLVQTLLVQGTLIAYLFINHRLLTGFAHALLNARQEAQLAHLDALTDLPNRRHLTTRLSDCAASHPGGFSVILLDIDHFKRVNDTYGHDVGDDVLRHLGTLLRAVTREGDCAGRWGGEEFLIVVVGPASVAQTIAERLRQELRVPVEPVGTVTVSAGVAQAGVGETVRDVLRRADEALYAAKRSGRDAVSVAA